MIAEQKATETEDAEVARDCARHIADAFLFYNAEFRVITRRAPVRFDTRDWKGSQRDAVERIELYDRFVNQTIAELRLRLGERALDRGLWARIRNEFAEQIHGLPDVEFTKTFFSSITRRLFGTVGVAPEIEFVATDLDPLADARRTPPGASGASDVRSDSSSRGERSSSGHTASNSPSDISGDSGRRDSSAAGGSTAGGSSTRSGGDSPSDTVNSKASARAAPASGPTTRVYFNHGSLSLLIENLLGDLPFRSAWRDLEKSVEHVVAEINTRLKIANERRAVERIEIIRAVFYQFTRAYVVGKIIGRDFHIPLVIALKNTDRGVLVDAVMLTEEDVSVVFGFARTYLHADLDRVAEAVLFIRSMIPRKPVSELFTVLGRARQGKTERYRELMRHLSTTQDKFVHAPGERGLVMVCFTLPSFDVVFKVIRDRFPYPKNIQREDVEAKYRMVFKHDRVGRLVDAQEFKRLRFPRALFAKELLEELLNETSQTVHEDVDDLVLDHVYIERRMIPLNLYLRTATPTAAERAVLDYGQCIRDLASTNIFAGDLLLKNFGVSRHGRVIFYDYDELCQVTDCHFRDIPAAPNPEDEMRDEPWYYVADNDVFPETFIRFLAFDDAQREAFLRVHSEVLTAEFWRNLQQRLREGQVIEVVPYNPHQVRIASST